jgi:hypothetical protein
MDDEENFFNKKFTITKVCKEPVVQDDGREKELSVIHLKDSKPMIVNTSNTSRLIKALGVSFTEEWVGKEIELTTAKVMGVDGRLTRALRVVVPKKVISGDDLASLLKEAKPNISKEHYIAARRVIENNETESFPRLRKFLNKNT